jgi:F-type H+-transporting ATPase subunit a
VGAARRADEHMMPASPLASEIIFHVGPVPVTRPVVTTWALMAVLAVGSGLLTRRLRERPGRWQTGLELMVTGIESQISEVTRRSGRPLVPLLGTLFIYLLCANLSGLLPGVQAPTGRIETPAALALIVFFAVHYFGVRARGLTGYLASFAKPKLIMLPLNIVSEITRTFSLMVRLFGNVMSGEFLIGLVLALAGLFVPVPLMALEVLVGVVQAYIFSVLATVFIGAAAGSLEEA